MKKRAIPHLNHLRVATILIILRFLFCRIYLTAILRNRTLIWSLWGTSPWTRSICICKTFMIETILSTKCWRYQIIKQIEFGTVTLINSMTRSSFSWHQSKLFQETQFITLRNSSQDRKIALINIRENWNHFKFITPAAYSLSSLSRSGISMTENYETILIRRNRRQRKRLWRWKSQFKDRSI